MSKSRGNTVEPWQVLDAYGADAFRWYFFTSKQPWDGYRFSAETIGEGVRLFLKQLWSTYYFYALYAQRLGDAARGPAASRRPPRRAPTATSTAGRCRAPPAPRSSSPSASTPTTRRPRAARSPRSWTSSRTGTCGARGGASGTATRPPSRRCARACWRSPSCSPPSARSSPMRSTTTSTARWRACTCATSPRAAERGPRDEELEQAMALARETVRLGLGARGQAKIKVRQPLARGRRRGRRARAGGDRTARRRRARGAQRAGACASSPAAEELGSYEIKANYRTLGPLFGKDMPLAAEAIAALDPAHVASRAARRRRASGSSVGGREHTLAAGGPDPDDARARGLQRRARGRPRGRARPGDRRGPARARAARARSSTRSRTPARARGLQVEDRIELALGGAPELLDGGARPPRLHRRARRSRWSSTSAPRRRRRAPAGLLRADRDRRPAADASACAALARLRPRPRRRPGGVR